MQRLLSSSSDNRLPQYAQERRVALRAVQLAAKVTASVQEQLISAVRLLSVCGLVCCVCVCMLVSVVLCVS